MCRCKSKEEEEDITFTKWPVNKTNSMFISVRDFLNSFDLSFVGYVRLKDGYFK